MKYSIDLIEAPSLRELSNLDVFQLAIVGRHVAGRIWAVPTSTEPLRIRSRAGLLGETYGDLAELDTEELIELAVDAIGEQVRRMPSGRLVLRAAEAKASKQLREELT